MAPRVHDEDVRSLVVPEQLFTSWHMGRKGLILRVAFK
jgi:hypothetical protein